jgi:hypothetical protein
VSASEKIEQDLAKTLPDFTLSGQRGSASPQSLHIIYVWKPLNPFSSRMSRNFYI